MTIGQLKKLLDKVPDTTILNIYYTNVGPDVNVEKMLYSSKRNIARLVIDSIDLDRINMARAVDRFDDEDEDGEEDDE